ncbi:hypothetical protein PROPJV5_1237 [Propionibacterium ruminifibrarum]|uniref:Uncharacterized protein n=1 Tax=Propionibacterium ruminifibrarum TaxID=1962131 RepID=A0A375I3K1_9ACTN|nr:hypothetical protein PROPJV5_1237 [Propionibacterium ruminifibrarum]
MAISTVNQLSGLARPDVAAAARGIRIKGPADPLDRPAEQLRGDADMGDHRSTS